MSLGEKIKLKNWTEMEKKNEMRKINQQIIENVFYCLTWWNVSVEGFVPHV